MTKAFYKHLSLRKKQKSIDKKREDDFYDCVNGYTQVLELTKGRGKSYVPRPCIFSIYGVENCPFKRERLDA